MIMKAIVGLCILLLLLAACDQGTGNAIKIKSPIQKCKQVEVPYDAIIEEKIPIKYEVMNAYTENFLDGFDVWTAGRVLVRNVDSESGQFTVEQTFTTLKDGSRALRSSHYIMPGETVEFRSDYDIDMGEDVSLTYKVIEPKKTVTKTVTKYRTEEQCD